METIILQGSIVKTQDDYNNNIGYYFDIINEHSVSASSNITTNWLENGSSVADHIANQPITVSLSGICGELVFEQNKTLVSNFVKTESKFNDKLKKISVLLPEVDNITQLYKNASDYVNASVDKYKNLFGKRKNVTSTKEAVLKFSDEDRRTKIQSVYQNLDRMRTNKCAFIVETPFKTFENMYIQSLSFKQSENLYIADIDITFVQVYFLDTKRTSLNKDVLAKYSELQRAEPENHGSQTGVQT